VKQGTLNLKELFERLGIKNPSRADFAEVSPVLVIGQLGHLTPYFEAPTYVGGGDLAAVAAEFVFCQIFSLAPGGTILQRINLSSNFKFGFVPVALAGGTVLPDRGPFSFDTAQVVVETGSVVADQLVGLHPVVANSTHPFPLFIPPGKILLFQSEILNTAVNNLNIVLQDVVATEIRPAS